MTTAMYEVVRFYFDDHDAVVQAEGLTLEEVRDHCSDPETSSTTCQLPDALAHTEKFGPWFDGYRKV